MIHRRTNPKIFSNSYELRHNQTDAENKLWQVLRSHQINNIHFRRQHAIGPYIASFFYHRNVSAPSVGYELDM